MKIEISIKTENAAFSEDPKSEVMRILREITDRISRGDESGTCSDYNGNRVGEWDVEDMPEPEEDRTDEGEEIDGTYGSGQTPCTVFVFGGWYVCDGSVNVNRAADPDCLVDGVDVEEVEDCNTFTWSSPIESINELIKAVEA